MGGERPPSTRPALLRWETAGYPESEVARRVLRCRCPYHRCEWCHYRVPPVAVCLGVVDCGLDVKGETRSPVMLVLAAPT